LHQTKRSMSILDYFQHFKLTNDQKLAIEKINAFLESDQHIFILKGYAGSGKTTLLRGVAEYLEELEKNYQLMAPTGRAAKVINQKTGIIATTVHKGIYSFSDLHEIENKNEDESVSFKYSYKIWNNRDVHHSILLIDEASMVSDVYSEGEFFRFGSGRLLSDLIEYSHIQDSNSTGKIIFIGDPAQLPPIGMNFSPALDENYLATKFNLKIASAEMKEVKRQDFDNGILVAASKIRKCLTSGYFNDFDLRENGKDIFNPNYEDFLETYISQQGSKIIIAYKNKTAADLNRMIRLAKYESDLPVQSGDTIIIGGNNYRKGIMNGEFGIVLAAENLSVSREIRFYKKGGGSTSVVLIWRMISLMMPDDNGQSKTVTGYVLENYLYGETTLTSAEQQALYVDFRNRFSKLKPGTEEFKEAIITDPFFNCILLKYGYAVTCHKAQGGEWDNTFVFWDYSVNDNFNFYNSQHNRSGKTNPTFYRWAYTAVTRASKKMYCINPPCFNSFSGLSFIDVNIQNSFRQLTNQSLVPIEINLDGKYLEALKNLNLQEISALLQNHFLKIFYQTNRIYIDIIKWERVGYEIRYYFKREGDTAAIKFWVNGKDEFKTNTFQKLPQFTNSNQFYDEIIMLIDTPLELVIQRNSVETILKKIEFDIDTEEEKPFLKVLFDSAVNVFQENKIEIEEFEHLFYKERYTLRRKDEKAVVDIEYNKDGFFGRIFPVETKCNSSLLIVDLKSLICKLQAQEYVI